MTAKQDGGEHPTGIPYIFLTNGGGVPEATRAKQLEEVFGVKVRPEQVCLSHSPMQPLADIFREDLVCVVGMSDVRQVAELYGFKNIITPLEIRHQFPTLVPHTKYDGHIFGGHNTSSVPSSSSTTTSFTKFRTAHAANEEAHALLSRVAAVLVMHDPRDWYVDLQVVLDILVTGREMNFLYEQEQARIALQKAKVAEEGLQSADPLKHLADDAEAAHVAAHAAAAGNCGSGGGCGHHHEHGAGACGTGASEAQASAHGCGGGACGCSGSKRKAEIPHTPIFFSNPDLLYSNSYRLPRLAQGAFAVCLNELYQGITGSPLRARVYGKPTPSTYKYADKLLSNELKRLFPNQDAEIVMTYGIGDNPSADIQGANQAGEHWTSVFVRTGTIPPSQDPIKQPKLEFDNVDIAVRRILGQHEN